MKSAETAARVDQLVRDAFISLNESIRAAQETETQQDFETYRHQAAVVIAGLYEYILHDLWVAFPDLEPEDMRKGRGPAERGPGEKI